jgi:hypothetical protein
LIELRCKDPARQCLDEANILSKFTYKIAIDAKSAVRKALVRLAQECLRAVPAERPPMSTVVSSLSKLFGDGSHAVHEEAKVTTYN